MRLPRFGLSLAVATALALSPLPAFAQQAADAITVVVPETPDSLDPCSVGQSQSDRIIRENVSETLTEISQADGSVTPRLATSWEQVNDKTWRFHLRPGVKFHDGTDFDAQSVIATLDRVQNGAIVCSAREKYFTDRHVTASAVDPMTVDITTEPGSPILPLLISSVAIVPASTPKDQVVNNPVGTGPYKFVEWVPNERVVIERFDGYWGDKPEIEKATYVWRSESAIRAGMVENGEADLAPVIAAQDATNPATDFAYIQNVAQRMRIDTGFAPLNDVRVRKALNLAIDRQGLLQILGKDFVLSDQYVAKSVVGYNPDIQPFPYDPDQARKLLADAKADGVPVDTVIPIIGRDVIFPNSMELMEAMMAMWADVGIQTKFVNTDIVTWLKYLRRPYPEDRGPMLLEEHHDNNYGDASFTIFNKYDSDGPNSTIYNKDLDALIDKAGAATGDERKGLYQQAFKMIHDDIVADVFMFYEAGYARVGPRIDWRPTPMSANEIQLATIKLKH